MAGALVNRLVNRYAHALTERLHAADEVRGVDAAWQLVHRLLDLHWQYRFLWRDLNDLLSRNCRLETQFQSLVKDQHLALKAVLDGLRRGHAVAPPGIERSQLDALVETMLVLLGYWLSHEYVRDPRQALEPPQADAALRRGAQHVMAVLLPYLSKVERNQRSNGARCWRCTPPDNEAAIPRSCTDRQCVPAVRRRPRRPGRQTRPARRLSAATGAPANRRPGSARRARRP